MPLAILLEFGLCKPIGLLWELSNASALEIPGYRVSRITTWSKPTLGFGSVDRYRRLNMFRYRAGTRAPRGPNRYRRSKRTAYLHGSEPEPPVLQAGLNHKIIASVGAQPTRNRSPPVLLRLHLLSQTFSQPECGNQSMQKPTFSQKPFRYADGLTLAQLEELSPDPKKALSEAERYRLVKASKSPTVPKPSGEVETDPLFEPILELDGLVPVFEAETKGPGRYTVIQYREWSEEYRLFTRVETLAQQPPLNDGPRFSEVLSDRAVRKITESCYYMAKHKGGYKTFVTGTFSNEVRLQIAEGETTIQREVSRTMDGLQKMYQRGWTREGGTRIEGHEDSLAYCWVVEVPKNEQGEDNPHVHIMMNWKVPYELFTEWSARIEGIWGNGYFHLEKIKDPLCAGSYMAKAAGYMCKAVGHEDQGRVKGNRYGISSDARAPGWYTVTEAELGVMGRLISEVHQRMQEKHGHLFRERAALKAALDKTSKDKAQIRIKIGKKLEQIRKKISSLPIHSGKYQLIFRRSEALYRFLGWAVGAGWKAVGRPISRYYAEFNRKMKIRREIQQLSRLAWSDQEWSSAVEKYSEYQQMECCRFDLHDEL